MYNLFWELMVYDLLKDTWNSLQVLPSLDSRNAISKKVFLKFYVQIAHRKKFTFITIEFLKTPKTTFSKILY